MVNNFRNGYTCKECADEQGAYTSKRITMTPIYRRIDKKFVFAGLVECYKHGITEAIALRDL